MAESTSLKLRAVIPLSPAQRLHLAQLRRCAQELGLPAGEAPSAFMYGVWAEEQAGEVAPSSGHLRAAFGNSWERACTLAGFERILSAPQ